MKCGNYKWEEGRYEVSESLSISCKNFYLSTTQDHSQDRKGKMKAKDIIDLYIKNHPEKKGGEVVFCIYSCRICMRYKYEGETVDLGEIDFGAGEFYDAVKYIQTKGLDVLIYPHFKEDPS